MAALSFLAPFNAKVMSHIEIADSFVISPKFRELAGSWNSLLVGPRGSGKTTLLRMLSLDGLRAWKGDEANLFRSEINYTGVYIPSDIAWGEMIKALSNNQEDQNHIDLIAESAFLTNVLLSIASAMQARLAQDAMPDRHNDFRRATISQEALEGLVLHISNIWKIAPKTASFKAVHQALSARLLEIRQQSRLLSGGHSLTTQELNRSMPYLGLPLVESVNLAISEFNIIACEPDSMWALLLDEFEVAPKNLQRVVLSALRASGQSKLIFKVALAPCGPHTILDLNTDNPPTIGHDYKQTSLWYADKAEAEKFCEDVFTKKIADNQLLSGKSANTIFGQSTYAIIDEDEKEIIPNQPMKAKQWEKDFESLATKDTSFKSFLEAKNIEPSNLDGSSNAMNGNVIRKIAPIVAFRNAYKKTDPHSNGKKRGRKPFNSAYAGWSAIAAISEGNPRWLIGMLTRIFSEVKNEGQLPIKPPSQTPHVMNASQTFVDILKTAAVNQFPHLQTSNSVYRLLNDIGTYFHKRIIFDDFKEDPPLSFIVDSDIDGDTENCLRIALNHGAIICYEPTDALGGYRTLVNKRFRLSYLLSPIMKLPVRKSKPVHLKSILRPTKPPIVQGDLF